VSAHLIHVDACEACIQREHVHRCASHTGYAIAAFAIARTLRRERLVLALAACLNSYDAPAWHENPDAHARLQQLGLVISPWGKTWGRDGMLRRRPRLIWLGELVLELLGRGHSCT
jgi:hypothetical protein